MPTVPSCCNLYGPQAMAYLLNLMLHKVAWKPQEFLIAPSNIYPSLTQVLSLMGIDHR